MNKDFFEKNLLDLKIVDYRNIYFIATENKKLFPSFALYIVGLYKEEIKFYKISYKYKIKSLSKVVSKKDVKSVELKKKHSDLIINFDKTSNKESYVVIDFKKNVYEFVKYFK